MAVSFSAGNSWSNSRRIRDDRVESRYDVAIIGAERPLLYLSDNQG